MTPDQVQKDLELVLGGATGYVDQVPIDLWDVDGTRDEISAAIARLRSVKLVAVEEAPPGIDDEVFVKGGAVFNKNIFEVVRHGTFFRYLYAGTVTVDENGKVDG